MIRSTLAVFAVLAAAVSPASALPVWHVSEGLTEGLALSSSAIEAQYRAQAHRPRPQSRPQVRHRRPARPIGRPVPIFVPGHHYAIPPRGWHRYPARPWNWHTRGCVMAGPFWFCP